MNKWVKLTSGDLPLVGQIVNLVYMGPERTDKPGFDLTIGFRSPTGWVDMLHCKDKEDMPTKYPVLGYFEIPPWPFE